MAQTWIQDADLVRKAVKTTTCPYCKATPGMKCQSKPRKSAEERAHPDRGQYDGAWYVHQARYDLVAPEGHKRVARKRYGHYTIEQIAKRLYHKDLYQEGISKNEAPWANQPETVRADYIERAKKERKSA